MFMISRRVIVGLLIVFGPTLLWGCSVARGGEDPEGILGRAGPPAVTTVKAYVVNEDSSDVWVIDVATRQVQAKVIVGKLPHAIATSPDGKALYVTNMGSHDITVINAESHATTTMSGTGLTSHEAAVSPDGRFLYVSNPAANSVTVHDVATHTRAATIVVGSLPDGVAISPDGTRVYIANRASNFISVIDTATANFFTSPTQISTASRSSTRNNCAKSDPCAWAGPRMAWP
jgi:YVTN family beta-propeller protein